MKIETFKKLKDNKYKVILDTEEENNNVNQEIDKKINDIQSKLQV